MVTVSSAEDSAPKSIFALSQCSAGSSEITVGCLTRGFSPADSITFNWKDGNNQERTDFVQYPAFGEGGDYTKISTLRVKKSEWDSQKPYTCEASNSKGRKDAKVAPPAPPPDQPATVYLTAPTHTELENGNATFMCLARKFSPKTYSFKWFQDGQELTNVIDAYDTSEKIGSVTLFSATSILEIPAQTWQKPNTKIKCEFEHQARNESREAEYTAHQQDCSNIASEIVPPSFEDMLRNRTGVLKCKASGAAGFMKIEIRANSKVIKNKSNFTYEARVELDVPIGYDEWSNGTVFECIIEHKCLAQPEVIRFRRENVRRVTPPTIALLSREEGDSIVLQCQVKDYYPDKLTVEWLKGDQPVNADDKKLQTTNKVNNNFTYISQISIGAQNEDKLYTCKATHNSEVLKREYNTCTAKSVFKPSIQVKKDNLRDILEESEVTFSCIVEAPHGTAVSWSANTAKKNTEAPKDLDNKIVSNWTLSKDEWLKLETIVCTAKHPCFPEENVKIQVGDMKKDPVVVIRRTFKKSDQSGSALLECVVKDLPFGEVCVSFQVNHSKILEVKCVDWTPSENMWSLTTHFTIPIEHQKKGNTFSCTVHSLFKSWPSEPTGNIFDDPTIELLVVSSVGLFSSDTQKLLCSGKGFNPKIKWISKSEDKTGTDLGIVTMREDARVKVFSEILVPQQEWEKDANYTCQIDDGRSGKTAATTSICSVMAPSSQQAEVYLLGPSQNHVRSGKDVNLTCLVVGQSAKFFSIQWKKNGDGVNENLVFKQPPIDYANGTQSKSSILNVSIQTWNKYDVFTCEVKHLCSLVTQQQRISKTKDPKKPTVRIFRPSDSDLSGLQNTSLLCFITGFFPSEISVEWQLNGMQLDVSHSIDSPVVAHTSGGFSMHSALILPAAQRKDGMYSCIVFHESSQRPFNATLRNLYASLIHSAPAAKLLQGANELVCLAYGFSPPAINITWLLGTTDVYAYNETNPAKGSDGKFSIRSHLQLPSDWAPGDVYTCRVTHVTGTQLLNISKKSAIFEVAIFMNENKAESIAQDTVEEAWNMACAFLALFLLSLLYGCTVTLVKVKPQ